MVTLIVQKPVIIWQNQQQLQWERHFSFPSVKLIATTLSMEGVSPITLIPYTIWRGSETQQMQMVTYSQSMLRLFFSLILPWMPVTQTPLIMLLWVTNMSADLPFLIVFQPPLLYLSDWRIKGYLLCVFTGILECAWYNEYSYGLHFHFVCNISQIRKFSIEWFRWQRFDNWLSDWQNASDFFSELPIMVWQQIKIGVTFSD
jgi:hypothetical protein